MAGRPNYAELVSQGERAVTFIADPELKRIAFQTVLEELRASARPAWLDSASRLIQVLSVVFGVVISVLSFNSARHAEAHARDVDADKKQTEAAKPFLELRQAMYLEAVRAAGVLANAKDHSDSEVKADDDANGGVLDPRASTVGGCTAHNAMIAVHPHDGDWEDVAALTGGASWAAPATRRFVERLGNCRHASRPLLPGHNPSGHGFDGWLGTQTADRRTRRVADRKVRGRCPLDGCRTGSARRRRTDAEVPPAPLLRQLRFRRQPHDADVVLHRLI